jgi:hypothetical protein
MIIWGWIKTYYTIFEGIFIHLATILAFTSVPGLPLDWWENLNQNPHVFLPLNMGFPVQFSREPIHCHTHISPNVSPCQVVWPRFRSRRSATGARREAAADRGGPRRARALGKAVPWRCSTVCGVVCGVLGRSPHESWLWLPGLVNLQIRRNITTFILQ